MMRARITKERKQEIENWLQTNFEKYNKEIDDIAAKHFGLSKTKISYYRLRLGLYFKGVYDVADYVKQHPGKSVLEYAKELGVSSSTITKANILFKLNLKHKYQRCVITKSQVATKTFKEVKEILGVTDSALSHMASRKNWRFADSQSMGRRENYHKIKTGNIPELAKILSSHEWCNKEHCQHNCLQCCENWLNRRTPKEKAKNDA